MTQTQMERQEWLEARRRGIGGSDAAVVLGLSRWKTPHALWLEKTGQSTGEGADSEAMHWGRALEPVIRSEYERRTGALVAEYPQIAHPDYGWMLANVDGLTDDGKVLEIKTARTADGWGEEGTDEVPEAYALQVQHYMAVTGREMADIAVLIGGSDFRIYTIFADAQLQADLIKAEAAFWERVQKREPPEITTYEEARQRWGNNPIKTNAAASDEEILQVWQEYRDNQHLLNDLQDKQERHKLEIMQWLHNHKATDLINEEGHRLATCTTTKGAVRFDSKAFAKDHPELYKQYQKQGEASVRFVVKI